MEHNIIQYNWESLSVEERKKRVEIRMQNLGKYKDSIIVNDPRLRGDA